MALSQFDNQDNTIIVRVHWSWTDLLLLVIVGFIVLIAGQFALGYINHQVQGNFFSPFIAPLELLWEAIVLIGLVYLVGLRRTHQSWAIIGLRPIPWLWVAGALALDLVILPLVAIASVLIRAILKQPFTPLHSPILEQVGSSWVAIGLTIVIGGMLTPFAEELFFRGVLYNFMQEGWGMWVGALGSALIFAVGHFSVSNAVSAFIFGFFFAVAYERSTSLWTSVLMHAALDSTILVLFFLSVGSIKT